MASSEAFEQYGPMPIPKEEGARHCLHGTSSEGVDLDAAAGGRNPTDTIQTDDCVTLIIFRAPR